MPDLPTLSDSQRHSVLAALCRDPTKWHSLSQLRKVLPKVSPECLKTTLRRFVQMRKVPGVNSNAWTCQWQVRAAMHQHAVTLLNDFRARLDPTPPQETPLLEIP